MVESEEPSLLLEGSESEGGLGADEAFAGCFGEEGEFAEQEGSALECAVCEEAVVVVVGCEGDCEELGG